MMQSRGFQRPGSVTHNVSEGALSFPAPSRHVICRANSILPIAPDNPEKMFAATLIADRKAHDGIGRQVHEWGQTAAGEREPIAKPFLRGLIIAALDCDGHDPVFRFRQGPHPPVSEVALGVAAAMNQGRASRSVGRGAVPPGLLGVQSPWGVPGMVGRSLTSCSHNPDRKHQREDVPSTARRRRDHVGHASMVLPVVAGGIMPAGSPGRRYLSSAA